MRGKIGLLSLAGAVLLLGQIASATTSDALTITSGALSATISDNGGCVGTGCVDLNHFGAIYDTNPSDGTTSGSTAISFNGWTISFTSGTSNSPSLSPFGIDIGSLTASCSSGTCTGVDSLHIIYSDVNFTVPVGVGGFNTFYSATITGSGTTSQSAYFSNSNTLFAETTLIGTVGPFTSPGGSGSGSGGAIAAVPSYSLTLDEVFSGAGSSFSVDGNITAVPEPVSVSLLGGVLFVTVGAIRRKMRRVV